MGVSEDYGRVYGLFRALLRWRWPALGVLVGTTVFLGSHLYPFEAVKFDYSFKRLFHAHGGNQDVLREFQSDFGDDVGLVSVLFVLPTADQEIPQDVVSGTVFEPKVVYALNRFTEALSEANEIDSDAVFSLTKVAKLHDSVRLNYVLGVLEELEGACRESEAWDASSAIAAVEGKGLHGRAPPEPIRRAVNAYKKAKASMLRHRLYRQSVFNEFGTATGVVARFAEDYVHDAERKPILSALSRPEQLSETQRERLNPLQLDHVLKQLPPGTQAHVSGMPVIQKTYTDITLEDMATFVPLISVAMALLLFLLFRFLWATIFPMVAVGFATVWSVGFMQWQGEPITLMSSVIPVLVLVIGVADAIHIISRYLHVAAETDDRNHAIALTMKHMAPPCMLAALTTAVGFGSLLVANIPAIRSFGVYAGYSILFAFIIQMTLIPIALSWVKKPLKRQVTSNRTEVGGRFFEWVFQVVTTRPRIVLGVTGVIFIAALIGVGHVSDNSRVLEELHADHPVSQALEQTEKHLTGVLVHAISFSGKESPDRRCARDSDCIDPSCNPDDCVHVGCCNTQVCKTVDRTRKLLTQLRLNLGDLSGLDQEPAYDETEQVLLRMRSQRLARKKTLRRLTSQHSLDSKTQNSPDEVAADSPVDGTMDEGDEDEVVIDDADEVIIDESQERADEDEIVIVDDGESPRGGGEVATAVTVSTQPDAPNMAGVCIESFKNAELLRAIARIDDWIEESVVHGATVSQSSSVVDILREMHFAIQGTYDLPDTLDRVMVENLLKEVKGDNGGLVRRVLTDDFTKANITIRANDRGTRTWTDLEADLTRKLREEIDENPSLASKVEYHITGSSTLAHGALHSIIDDMGKSIGLAFVFIWLLISVLFRSIRIGFIAMFPNIWPLLITLGFMGFAGMSLRVSSVIIFTISLGIAVDDTIHYLARLREEARRGLPLPDIIKNTTFGTGRAVVLTTVILVTGLSVNGLSEFIAMEQFGLLSAFTLFTALAGVLFLLPVLIQVFQVAKSLR